MAFESLDELLRCFRDHGATRVVAKQLAENDNSKQQIYLGGSFEVLQLLPQASIKTESGAEFPLAARQRNACTRATRTTHSLSGLSRGSAVGLSPRV
jgi:hypothetical protein